VLVTSINTKQNTILSTTPLSCVGSNITYINYNTLSNLPTTFNPDLTYIYTKAQIDNYINNSCNYTSNVSNVLVTSINTKQNTILSTTPLSCVGSNITYINYNTLSNLPSTFPADVSSSCNYTTNVSNVLVTSINTKQNIILSTTPLSCVGSNITYLNYSNISNLPSTFPPDLTNIYTKTQIGTLPLLLKKQGINFRCTTSITINSTNYYKYDINLSNYTSNLYTDPPTNAYPYRLFSINGFISSGNFDTLYNSYPQVFQYDVYMASLSTGINVCALGTPENYNLINNPNTQLFLLRTSNYNYLSVISPTSNISVNCIIKDNLY
jgi:hypothetical protein